MSAAALPTTKDGRPLSALLGVKARPDELTSEEIEMCLQIFTKFDHSKQGLIRLCDLAAVLEAFTGGVAPRSEEVFEVRARERSSACRERSSVDDAVESSPSRSLLSPPPR